MTAEAASGREFAKEHIVTVPFSNLPKAVFVALRGCGNTRRENVLFSNDRLERTAKVIASCVECFGIRSAGLCENLAR